MELIVNDETLCFDEKWFKCLSFFDRDAYLSARNFHKAIYDNFDDSFKDNDWLHELIFDCLKRFNWIKGEVINHVMLYQLTAYGKEVVEAYRTELNTKPILDFSESDFKDEIREELFISKKYKEHLKKIIFWYRQDGSHGEIGNLIVEAEVLVGEE